MLLRACLLTSAVVLALAGCGGDDDDAASTTAGVTATEAPATTDATTTTESPTTTVPATTTTEGTTTTDAADPLAAALLTADDVGEGFVATPSADSEPDETTPCGTPSPGTLLSTGDRESVDIANEERGLQVSHTVERYTDEAIAQQAMTLGQAGLACGSGTSTNDDGSTVDFELQEVAISSPIGDDVFAYSGTATTGGQSFDVIFVAIRDGRAIAALTFLSTAGDPGPPVEPILATVEEKLATVA
jgi:hypothetical protein